MHKHLETPWRWAAVSSLLAAAGCMPTDVDFSQNSDIDADCETIIADLTVASAADARALPQKCFNVTGSISVLGSDLSDLESLRFLRGVDILRIEGNQGLATTDGLSRVKVAKSLIVRGNASLREVVGLDSSTKIGSVTIEGNEALDDLDSLALLQDVDNDLVIRENGALGDLKFLSELGTVGGDFRVEGNTNLKRLGFNRLTGVTGDFTISDNRNLVETGGLGQLQTVGLNYRIERNPSLAIINGHTNSLERVGGELVVQDNATLSDVFDLAFNLYQVSGSVTVINNPALSQCRADDFEEYIEIIGGDLDVGDNGLEWDPCH